MGAPVLALWVVATLAWWAFAFAPLPSIVTTSNRHGFPVNRLRAR